MYFYVKYITEQRLFSNFFVFCLGKYKRETNYYERDSTEGGGRIEWEGLWNNSQLQNFYTFPRRFNININIMQCFHPGRRVGIIMSINRTRQGGGVVCIKSGRGVGVIVCIHFMELNKRP